jgi:hypothetical protein
MKPPLQIAWFITPHGFGHAARAVAIMLALRKFIPVHFHIFTRTPDWFFQESFLEDYTYHEYLTDIGLAQRTSLDEDLPETLRMLGSFYPLREDLINQLSFELRKTSCQLVVGDIAPVGFVAAAAAGIPSVLVENFTWDWIYEGYLQDEPAFDKYIKILKGYLQMATAHIQTRPVCLPGEPTLTSEPVSRPLRAERAGIRQRLKIPDDTLAVLITMGGIETSFDALYRLEKLTWATFIIPGGSSSEVHQNNLRLLPHHSGIYHPDLVSACDGIIGKLGYSTLAECYLAGTPFGFIPRSRFRESPPLTRYVLENMAGIMIREEDYVSGKWLDQLPELLRLPRITKGRPNGADQIADWLIRFIAEKGN